MPKLLFRKHVSSWLPAGIAQQSQDKQVAILRLYSRVSKVFGTEMHIFSLSTEFMESTQQGFFF